jgi:DNA-binding PucR family transcriptional regulator
LAALVWHDTGARSPRLPDGTITGRLRDDLRCALIPDPGGPGRATELERAVGRLTAALGPATTWLEAASSARRAAATLTLADRGVLGPGLLRASEHMGDLVTHADPGLIEDLAAGALASLDQETPASRERLEATLRAWLDHHGSAGAMAEALHVHPQTVRYRLARLRELFGEMLEEPGFRFELALALRARRGAA